MSAGTAAEPRLAPLLRLGRAALFGAGEALVSLAYPPACADCGAATGNAHGLCPRCWTALAFIERPFCERLGTPFPFETGGEPLLSPAAIADPPVFSRARAALRYDERAAALVARLKYADRPDLARLLGGLAARAGHELAADADAIVPVPLHRIRLWRRRYNQAALLAQVVAKATNRPLDPFLLARVRPTEQQVGLTKAQRRENRRGAFRVPEPARPRLQGRRILLVDDVLTTGATANAASRALLRGGAAAVDILVVARVVLDG